jgi:hypothetical protein
VASFPYLTTILADEQAILANQAANQTGEIAFETKVLAAIGLVLQQLAEQANMLQQILAWASNPSTGMFNPPADLVVTKVVEVEMSVIQLIVGQTAEHDLTFSEPDAPLDGAVASDNDAVATISLQPSSDPANVGPTHWVLQGLSVGVANITYSGTSRAPDAGPAQVAPMVVTVVAAPQAETGDFNPAGATITGP